MRFTRQQIYLMHEAARQAEANGLDEYQAAEDFRAAAQLHNSVGDAGFREAQRLDAELLARGDRRPSKERFADIDAVLHDPSGIEQMSDAQAVNCLRGVWGEEWSIRAAQQLRPGLPYSQAQRIVRGIQTGGGQEATEAFRQLNDFQAQDAADLEHQADVRQMAMNRGGRRYE